MGLKKLLLINYNKASCVPNEKPGAKFMWVFLYVRVIRHLMKKAQAPQDGMSQFLKLLFEVVLEAISGRNKGGLRIHPQAPFMG